MICVANPLAGFKKMATLVLSRIRFSYAKNKEKNFVLHEMREKEIKPMSKKLLAVKIA